MKKYSFLAGVILAVIISTITTNSWATSTTYQFMSASWTSQVGSIKCDGKTDGWIGEANGEGYDGGKVYPVDGMLHNAGIQVTKALSGKKVTSVLEFENVRRVIVNYCVSSNGKGDITIAIGDTTMSKHVEKSMKVNEDYSLNEDVEFVLLRERSGKVILSVENITKSSVYINSITIKADNGSGDVFSTKVYHLVTDLTQLQDDDLIMIGVADGKTNKALGYYDADVSKNNIHAVNAKYDTEREYINANEEVTYVLNKAVSSKGADCFTIIDPYAEAYLVASGGQTKNKLTIWDSPYDDKSFGDYGYWAIQVANDGKATIMSLGNSKGKYMQYNASGDLFGCYESETQTAVSIYRQEEAKDLTQPMIVASMVNFGTQVMRGTETLEGSKTIEVKANKLTEDISVSLKDGSVFSLNTPKLDRDGEKLTVSFNVPAAGKYEDALVLTSGEVTEEVPVHLTVARELTIAEAVKSGDFEYIYLNPLTVTKKNGLLVYVRDETGSMLLYDNGPTDNHYAAGLEKGNVIREVEGKFQNYFGVPELHMMAKPKCDVQKVEVLPEIMTACADSADVCRYVVYECVKVTDEGGTSLVAGEETLPLSDKFKDLGSDSESFNMLSAGPKYTIEGIVSYDWDVVVLYPTKITKCEETGTENLKISGFEDFKIQMLPDGRMVITNGETTYDLRGVRIHNVLD